MITDFTDFYEVWLIHELYSTLIDILITNISVYRSMEHYVFTNIEEVGVGKVSDHDINRDGECKFVPGHRKCLYYVYCFNSN